jgi:hypothetical protein
MSRKIIGVTVGTPMNPEKFADVAESAYDIAVKNGFDGTEAEWLASLNGNDGKDGVDGKDGYTPIKGVDYFDGRDGTNGKDGVDGKSAYAYAKDGGYMGTEEEYAKDTNPDNIKAAVTPELGVDYFTENDQANIVARVYDLIKNGGVVGFVDENNNIVLTGNIADGEYTLKYENVDGTYTDIGTLEVGAVEPEEPDIPTIINLATPDANASGETAWQSGGWCNDSYMAGSSYAYRAATDGKITTNTIAVEHGDVIYVKGIKYNAGTFPQIAIFDADGTHIRHGYASSGLQNAIKDVTGTEDADYWYFTNTSSSDADTGVRYIRLAGMPSGSINDIVITRNQPIE